MTMSPKVPALPCGYGCSKPWRRWVGSKLKGHARCAMSPEGQEAILSLMEQFPKASQKRVAADFGVSVAVLRAWLSGALRQRRASREKQTGADASP